MVFIRFSGFILVLLLGSFALQSLSIHGAHDQERRLVEGGLIKEATNKGFEHVQEHVVETLAVGSGSNVVRIRGRKMAMMSKEDERMGSRSSTGEVQKLKVEAGFVAFTADYHMAKRHPPKNN